MNKRLALLVGMAVASGTLSIGAALPAGASSWGTYTAQCSKWIGDIPKLDSYIIADNKDGNMFALTASMVALFADGKHIAACHSSPDTQLNNIARQWGAAIENAGAYGYRWATHKSSANLLAFVSAESTAKKYENQFSNRLAALGR
ncbi:MAG: hypothetical protein ACYC1I_09685 [Acidimicrobiales bacterium]